MRTVADWIARLQLAHHPEGGYYRETYRSTERIPANGLPVRFQGERPVATAIYYLLPAGEVSVLHRLKSDELWHFYDGGALHLHLFGPDGNYHTLSLSGDVPQAVVSAGNWFGAELAAGAPYALVGCTVAPGFDFRDFELASRAALLARHPEHPTVIERLTKAPAE